MTTRARIVVIFSALFALFNSFIQDDAYISLRYARNLVEGYGLVFNPGERIEGYTNFLWTLILSIPHALNISNYYFILFTGIALLVACMYYLYRSTLLYTKKEHIAFLLLILLGGNFSFSSYVTGGLETQLQATLFIALIYFCLKTIHQKTSQFNYLLIGLISSLIILNRLDGALIVFISILFVLYTNYKRKKLISRKTFAMVLPIVLLLLPWLFWKYNYYGSLLPNTFNAKVNVELNKSTLILRGLAYISAFYAIYFALPFLVYLYNSIKSNFFSLKPNVDISSKLPLSVVFTYLIYYIYVGGDFMEFRFMVPLLPIFLLTTIRFLTRLNKKALATLVITYLCCSFIYMSTFTTHKFGLESVHYLESHMTAPDNDWIGIGQKLQDISAKGDFKIAVGPAGAIPYFSRLYTIDMLGLNDEHIAKNGLKYRDTPGHFKMTSLDYLQKKGVHLVIGHPIMIKTKELSEFRKKFYEDRRIVKKILPTVPMNFQADKIKIVEIPINNDYSLISWYLNKSDALEKAASKKSIKIITI